jgi:hypothetical protein
MDTQNIIVLSIVWIPVAADKWVCNLWQDNKPHTQWAAKVHLMMRMHQDLIKYHTTKWQHHARDSSVQAEAPSLKDKSVAGGPGVPRVGAMHQGPCRSFPQLSQHVD